MDGFTARRLGLALALSTVSLARPASAEVSDPAFIESVHLQHSGLAGTTAMAWAPDGSNRLFYTRQLGQIWMVDGGKLKGFASLSPIYSGSECGVLGLAFHPNFVVNHYLYVFVTVSKTEQQIVRFTVDGNTAKDQTVVVAGLPTRGSGHDAGSIGFGPDGKLYWSIGDLAVAANSEDMSTLAGKISRANLDGSAPADNPFFDADGPNEDRIWARGFRNPFTFTWQPATDRLWVNTVGENHEQIFTPRAGDDAGWSSYENNQPDGYLSPILAYPKQALPPVIAAGGASRHPAVATFATTKPHGLRPGTRVTIAGVSDASFDGVAYVSAVPTSEAFSVAQPGPDASSGGGTATPIDLGNCITGGTFWDSSSVPASYRGNFFFGDFISTEIGRVTFVDDDRVASLDTWRKGGGSMIDMAVGPDGDLYYTTFQGAVYRIHYAATAQGIVVDSLHLRVQEAGVAVFSVRLALAPTEAVTVAIERTAGDADVSAGVSQLTFDPSNWSTPQAVQVAAGEDDDAVSDEAELTLSSTALPSERVVVRVTDDDALRAGAPPDGNGGATDGNGGASPDGSGGISPDGAGGISPDGGAAESAGAPSSRAEGGAEGVGGQRTPDGGAPATSTPDEPARGCDCNTPRSSSGSVGYALGLLAIVVVSRRRRSR